MRGEEREVRSERRGVRREGSGAWGGVRIEG